MKGFVWVHILIVAVSALLYSVFAKDMTSAPNMPRPTAFVLHASEYIATLGNVYWLENTTSHECYTVVYWSGTGYAMTPASCPSAER